MKDILGLIQYYAAPIAAPVPTALAVGAALNHSLSQIPGNPAYLALIGAVCGAAAIELGGGMMFGAAGRAFARRKTNALRAAVIGAIMYVAIVIYSISLSGETNALIGSVLITFVVYTGKGIFDYLDEDKYVARAAVEISQADANINIGQMDAERRLINAQTRNAKVGGLAVSRLSTGQATGQTTGRYISDPAQVQRIKDYWTHHPDSTLRTVAAACGCSPMTAGRHRP